MIYFYAGMGAVMLSGIMMLFEIGLALTGQSLFDSRDSSESKNHRDMTTSSEKLFLTMLSRDQQLIGDGLSGSALCQQILCRIKGKDCRSGNSQSSLYKYLDGEYSEPLLASPSTGLWASACVLEDVMNDSVNGTDKKVIHRVIVLPGNSSATRTYRMFSCISMILIDDVDSRCSFEIGA